jgi:capsular exopolysaccharide synthesis family protein
MGKRENSDSVEIVESNNFFKSIAYRYVPYWPIFALAVIFALVGAGIYIHYQSPVYEASASILLKDDKSNDQGSNILESLNITSTKKNVENELVVLKSRSLIRQVVTDLGLYAQTYQKGTVRDVLIYPSSPVSFVAINPEKIKNVKQPISFEYMPLEKMVRMGGKKYPLNQPVNTPYGIFQINKMEATADLLPLNEKEHPFSLLLKSVQSAAKELSGSFSVTANSKQSSVITLSFVDENPERAEVILNSLINVYRNNEIEDKNIIAAHTLNFLEDRLKIVNGELSKVEGDIQEYKSKENIVDVSEESKVFLTSVQASDLKINEINIQLSVLDQVEKYIVRKGDTPGIVPGTAAITDQLLTQLLLKLYDDEIQLDRLRKISGENSPSINDIKIQIAQLKPSILENVHTIRQNLLASRIELQNDNNRLTSSLKLVPQKERGLLEISRDQFIKSGIYSFLLQKREETQLSLASSVSDTRIIDAAESNLTPIKPVKANVYLIAIVLGILAAVIFVLIREVYNNLILFRSEIEYGTSVPVIAEILFEPGNEPIVIKDGNKTVIAEQFRSLRTSLSYLGVHDDKKVILLTSSISGEGKSFTVINLAITLTLANKKVVLLELDLRKPKFSNTLNIPRENGITEYLVGLASVDEIIKTVKDIPNLYVCSAGAVAPNPTELILNKKLDILMEKLKKEFDYILIDSPPVNLITDAKLLNAYADVCLYIVRHNYTPKAYLKMIDEIYENNELSNLNIIFNGIKPRGVFNNGHGHGYGQGYGYGYGYGYSEESNVKSRNIFKRIGTIFHKN